MIINGIVCCDFCRQAIGAEKKIEKIPHFPKDKDDTEKFEYYHNRFGGDCFTRENNAEKGQDKLPKQKRPTFR